MTYFLSLIFNLFINRSIIMIKYALSSFYHLSIINFIPNCKMISKITYYIVNLQIN